MTKGRFQSKKGGLYRFRNRYEIKFDSNNIDPFFLNNGSSSIINAT